MKVKADSPALRAGLYQSNNEYASLHIIVTDNAVYLKDRAVFQEPKSALLAIEAWLTKHMPVPTK